MNIVTTASQLRAMLREEAAEPLSYPRLGGVSAEYLVQYNYAYGKMCRIAAESELDDEAWAAELAAFLARWEPWRPSGTFILLDAYNDALSWIRTEFDGIEVPS